MSKRNVLLQKFKTELCIEVEQLFIIILNLQLLKTNDDDF